MKAMPRARRLVLPVLLALLSGACANTGASLREVLNSAGGRMAPPESDWKSVQAALPMAPDGKAAADAAQAPSVASRVATRPFFVAEPLETGQPLPTDRIPRAEFPEIQMSDALLYLLRNVTLRLAVDADLQDQTINNLVLEGSFADALGTLAKKGRFAYVRQGDVLRISSRVRYSIALPPIGYVGPKGRRDASLPLTPFEDLASRLLKAGAQDVSVDGDAGRLVFATSVAAETPILGVLEEWRQREEMLAWKLTVLRLSPGPLDGKSWNTFSPDLKPVSIDGDAEGMQAYAGAFDADAIADFLKALKHENAPVETGVALLPANLPVSFSPAAALCPAAKGKKSHPPATLTLQARRDGGDLRTNFSASLPGCKADHPSAAFTTPVGQSVLLVGVGGDLAVVLEPQVIRFASQADTADIFE